MLPFTSQQFFAIFAAYGQAIWPAQIAAYVAGIAAVAALAARRPSGDAVILGILSLMWAVTGIGYHFLFFARINAAAYVFAVLFIVQAGAFAAAAVRRRVVFGWRKDFSGLAGAGLIVYAAIAYPLIGLVLRHPWLEIPAFGLTPCPLTLFTFGLVLLTVSPVPMWLLVIPVLWSVIGGTAAILLSVPQDWVLLFSGAATLVILYLRRNSPAAATMPASGAGGLESQP